MSRKHWTMIGAIALFTFILSGCVGTTPSVSIGGTVTGLNGTLILQNNGTDNLEISSNGTFTFPTSILNTFVSQNSGESNYKVTVLQKPEHQTCTIVNGTGSILDSNITNIKITCSQNVHSIKGTISGLSGTVVLQNNGGDNLTLTTNGIFTFSTKVAEASDYKVTVLTQPAHETCSVAHGVGIAAVEVTDVIVICSTITHSIGGSVNGLTGTVVLQNNSGDNLSISSDGSFTFATVIADGLPFVVSVLTQPVHQTCLVTNGNSIANADVTNVTVTCTTNTHTIGGTITGLSGTVVLQNNGADNLSRSANGVFTFATTVDEGSSYLVTVSTQPAHQTCSVSAGSGTANANVTNVAVTCSTITRTIGGSISGLTGTVVLQNNGADNLSRSSNGAFTFATPIADGSAYAVTVLTQPTGQTCNVTSGAGTANGNVSNVSVSCSVNTYTIGGTITGLSGTVVLQNNGGNNLSRSANGAYTFTTHVTHGSPYAVTVLTQPSGQTCNVTNDDSGTATSNVNDITVDCSTNTFTIGGSISGLSGTIVLQNNGGDNLTRSSNGSFTFGTSVNYGSSYAVTIFTQPSGQYCFVSNDNGSNVTSNITSVSISCSDEKIIFFTAATTTGNMNGSAGADSLCNSDSNKPNGSTYKALVVDTARVACTTANCGGGSSEHTDWVLAANTPYVRADGTTLLDVSNADGILSFPLSNQWVPGSSSTDLIWTGLSSDWTSSTNNCADWTVADTTQGQHGRQNATNANAISDSFDDCNNTFMIACVEQ